MKEGEKTVRKKIKADIKQVIGRAVLQRDSGLRVAGEREGGKRRISSKAITATDAVNV